jgi:ribosomal protein S18 acetylase RimI-like enzyme
MVVQVNLINQNHIDGIKSLADANRESLGFMPRKKLEEIATQHRAFVALHESNVIGFVIFRHRKRDLQTTLSEICVHHKYRGQGIGSDLIQSLIYDCNQRRRDYIQLKCPTDLPANKFYEHLGFELYMTEAGKKRKLNVWRLTIEAKKWK